MTTIERAMPPLQADERATMEGWLDFYRATLAQKCEGLTDEQLRTASVPPSPLTLLGLVQHMAEVGQARENCAGRELDATSPFMGGRVTLRWILSHMSAEYPRHAGHADLIR